MVKISSSAYSKKINEQLRNYTLGFGGAAMLALGAAAVTAFLTYFSLKNGDIIEITNLYKYSAMAFGTLGGIFGINAIYSKVVLNKCEIIAEDIEDITLQDEKEQEVEKTLDIVLTNDKGVDLKSQVFGDIGEMNIHELKLVMEALKLEADATYLEYEQEGKIVDVIEEDEMARKLTYKSFRI